jgi:hypothetical protein
MPHGFYITKGPYSGSRHDAACYTASGLDNDMRLIAAQNGRPFIFFGDSAFGRGPHMQRMYKNARHDPLKAEYNKEMAAFRIAVEWSFGGIKNLFPYINYALGLRLGAMPVGKIVQVAFFFKNCHTAAYGNQIADKFKTLHLTRKTSLRGYILKGQAG